MLHTDLYQVVLTSIMSQSRVIDEEGFVLAGMEGIKYRKNELQITPGDKMYLYTDGVTEATDNNEELYGEQRLLDFVNSLEKTEPDDLCKRIKKDVDRFVDTAPQFDDITMLCMKYQGKRSEATE